MKRALASIATIMLVLSAAWYVIPSGKKPEVTTAHNTAPKLAPAQPQKHALTTSSTPQQSSGDEKYIHGIAVPPVPNKTENDATLQGIDNNHDGVRDDINIYLAKHFGDDPVVYPILFELQKLEYTTLLSPTNTNIDAALHYTMCVGVTDSTVLHKDILTKNDEVTRIAINTEARAKQYQQTFAGKGTTIDLSCRI